MRLQRGGYESQEYTTAAEAAHYAPARGDYERQAQAAQAARALEKNTNVMNVSKEVENVLTPYTVQEHPSDKSSAGPGMYWKQITSNNPYSAYNGSGQDSFTYYEKTRVPFWAQALMDPTVDPSASESDVATATSAVILQYLGLPRDLVELLDRLRSGGSLTRGDKFKFGFEVDKAHRYTTYAVLMVYLSQHITPTLAKRALEYRKELEERAKKEQNTKNVGSIRYWFNDMYGAVLAFIQEVTVRLDNPYNSIQVLKRVKVADADREAIIAAMATAKSIWDQTESKLKIDIDPATARTYAQEASAAFNTMFQTVKTIIKGKGHSRLERLFTLKEIDRYVDKWEYGEVVGKKKQGKLTTLVDSKGNELKFGRYTWHDISSMITQGGGAKRRTRRGRSRRHRKTRRN